MSQIDTLDLAAPAHHAAPARAEVGERVDIAFGVDSNFVPHMAAVIASIVRAAPGAKIRFIVLHDVISAERKALVQKIAPNAEFCWIEVGDKDMPDFHERMHYTRAIMFRLGLETMAPADCRRVIYLDSDIVVEKDIRELWRTDLQGAAVGAVVDTFTLAEDFAGRWSLPLDKQKYFNSGVLLIDLDKVRAEKIFTKAMGFIAKYDHLVTYSDQDALNWVLWGRWFKLDQKWNVQTMNAVPWIEVDLPAYMQIRDRAPAIIHFTGEEKPWLEKEYHPWHWLYYTAIARTPFAGEVWKRYHVRPQRLARLFLRWLRRRPRGSRLTG